MIRHYQNCTAVVLDVPNEQHLDESTGLDCKKGPSVSIITYLLMKNIEF